jgi:hypothetical protein
MLKSFVVDSLRALILLAVEWVKLDLVRRHPWLAVLCDVLQSLQRVPG